MVLADSALMESGYSPTATLVRHIYRERQLRAMRDPIKPSSPYHDFWCLKEALHHLVSSQASDPESDRRNDFADSAG